MRQEKPLHCQVIALLRSYVLLRRRSLCNHSFLFGQVVVSKQNQDAKQKELKEQTEQEKESKKAKKAAAKEAKMAAKAAKEAKKKAEQAKPKRRPGRPCKNESKAMSSSGAAGSAVPAVPLHDVEEPAPAPKCKASKKKESAKKPKQPDDQVEACPKPKAKAKAKGKSGKRGLPATEHADPIAPAAEHAVEPIPMAPQAALEEQDRPIAPAAGGAPPAVEAVREEKRRRIGCARKKHPELANLPLFEYVELSVYWTRVGVGIKLKDEKKQEGWVCFRGVTGFLVGHSYACNPLLFWHHVPCDRSSM